MNIIKVYKTIRDNGFTSKGRDKRSDDKHGIKCSFVKGRYYIEIHPCYDYFDVHLMGGEYNPYTNLYLKGIEDSKDLQILDKFLKTLK